MPTYNSPGVYINEIDVSAIVQSESASIAFFAGNFDEGYVEYPQMITNKSQYVSHYGTPTDQNYNEWFQPYKFFDYANKLIVNRPYEYTNVNNTPSFSDFAYKGGDYYDGNISGANATIKVKRQVGEIPNIAIGEWLSLGNQTILGKVTNITSAYTSSSPREYYFTITIHYDGTPPSSVPPSGEYKVHSLRFLNGETQGVSRGDVNENTLTPVEAKTVDESLSIDYFTDTENINPNRLKYKYELVKNPYDFEYKHDNGELSDFFNFSGEHAKVKFISRSPSDKEIEIAIANSYDFNRVNGGESKAIAFREVSGDVVNDTYLTSLFQYSPQDDEVAIAIKKGEEIETFIVSFDPESTDGNGKSNYIETVINNNSKFVYVVDNTGIDDLPASYLVCDRFGFDNAANAVGVPCTTLTIKGGRSIKVTESALRNAYFDVSDKEQYEIDIVIGNEYVFADGDNLNIAIELADYRKDCIAYIGARYRDTVGKRSMNAVNAIVDYITENDPIIRNGSVKLTMSMFGAFFGNYVKIQDPFNKKFRWINIAGDMAGIKCYVNTTKDAWWVSAGMQRGVVRNIETLAFTPSLPQRDILYKNHINPVVVFPDTSTMVWGNRTLLPYMSGFSMIHIRSLFNILERAMAKAARSQVFEFNDVYTRNAIVSMFSNFLETVKAGRGIEEYLVVCDETNNTPQTIAEEKLIVDIYIKPMYAAEFIQLNFVNVGTRSISQIIGTV